MQLRYNHRDSTIFYLSACLDQEPFVLHDDEDDVSSPARNTKNYLWWIPNIVVSQSNLTVPVKNISWLKPVASQEVEMKQFNFSNSQFVLFNPGSLGRC